eukprot:663561-Ditylum_brightwellii.AAC.1
MKYLIAIALLRRLLSVAALEEPLGHESNVALLAVSSDDTNGKDTIDIMDFDLVDSYKADPRTRSLTLRGNKGARGMKGSKQPSKAYEVWGSDQSNSLRGITSPGAAGSFLWIWDSASIQNQLENDVNAAPLSCLPGNANGPCNLLHIFPAHLVEMSATSPTGHTLGDLMSFGRLHGVIKDPSNRYVNANIFAPNGGYVGIIDTHTKEAV